LGLFNGDGRVDLAILGVIGPNSDKRPAGKVVHQLALTVSQEISSTANDTCGFEAGKQRGFSIAEMPEPGRPYRTSCYLRGASPQAVHRCACSRQEVGVLSCEQHARCSDDAGSDADRESLAGASQVCRLHPRQIVAPKG
jgi:hypothetical protein